MRGGTRDVAKAKKIFKDADLVIHNNFQTKPFHSAMNSCLHFPQVSTHSPLFYGNSHYIFKTAQL